MLVKDGPSMTAADLVEHRVKATETTISELAGTVRSLEREVDRLKIEGAAVIAAVSKLEGRLEERDKNLRGSLSRLHERLDERLAAVAPFEAVAELSAKFSKLEADEFREEGAHAERRRLWKAWFNITVATVAVLTLVAAIVFGLAQAI